MSKAVALICIALGIVLLVCFAFGVYVLLEATNYCHCKATDFWVSISDDRYYFAVDELVISDTDIAVHYLVDWLSRKQGYTYKVVPAGNDFGYMIDGTVGNWLGIDDLTPAFEFIERADSFTIQAKGKAIADVLQVLNPTSKIVAPSNEDEVFHFKLIVSSVDGKTVELTFRCAVAVDIIELDPPSIEF